MGLIISMCPRFKADFSPTSNISSELFFQSGVTTSVVMLLIATSMAMSWVLAYKNISQDMTAILLRLTESKIATPLLINVILPYAGTFMDMSPAVFIFTPIFPTVMTNLGMHPIHFGIVMKEVSA